MNLRLPSSLQLFNQQVKTIVFNSLKQEEKENLQYYQVTQDVNLVHQVVHALYQLKIQSVLVEGGAQLLQSFIDEGLWDEIRLITNNEQVVANGLPAPRMESGRLLKQESLFSDTIHYFVNPQTPVH
jgi:diaminohydroxyphosphoribosylaminopyrimidine deaminase/5-amino-6-(5-phosphoribosylamino)uracil reductase